MILWYYSLIILDNLSINSYNPSASFDLICSFFSFCLSYFVKRNYSLHEIHFHTTVYSLILFHILIMYSFSLLFNIFAFYFWLNFCCWPVFSKSDHDFFFSITLPFNFPIGLFNFIFAFSCVCLDCLFIL